MTNTGVVSLLLVIANVAFSYKGFISNAFFEQYKFEVDSILVRKEYKRLVTSGFLHVSWMHLIFNMLSLYAFSGAVEYSLGAVNFLIVYFASLVGGDLLALFVHRNHGEYSSVGASGAVCGIIFASIALYPGMSIGFFILPFSVPGWLYGVLYIAFSIYGIKSKRDNTGHEAHLGGALIGMMTTLIIYPSAFASNYLTILIITVPTMVFIYLIVTRPHILLVDHFNSSKNYYSVDHQYNEIKNNNQREIDRILDKIGTQGIESLNRKEKEQLEEYSKR